MAGLINSNHAKRLSISLPPPPLPLPRFIDWSVVWRYRRFLVRSHAIRALRLLLEAREARERALATGMDAVLQDLRSRTAESDDSAFAQAIQVTGRQQGRYFPYRMFFTNMSLRTCDSVATGPS